MTEEKTNFPDDWPEDAKVGPKFLGELMRRFPNSVKVIDASLPEAMEEFFKDGEKP